MTTTLLAQAVALDPLVLQRGVVNRSRMRRWRRSLRAAMAAGPPPPLASEAKPVRVTVVSPEPTPFRSVMFDRIAQRPELDFTVIYASRSVQRRWWTIEHHHRAVFVEGRRVPGMHRLLRHDYPVGTGVLRELTSSRPDLVVVSGWSTFACQAAFAWCRRHKVPYVLLVESNDRDERPGWRRIVKGAVVPRFIHGADTVFAIGTLAREAVIARGADPARVRWFANTVDAQALGEQSDRLAVVRERMRSEWGLSPADVVVVCVARLAPEKGIDTLVRAVAAASDPRLVLVLVGEGDQRDALELLATDLGVRLVILGHVPWDRIAERFVPADIFALLSTHEPWGVVVNEAAACGLPLVLSDRVGAAFDLLVEGSNGFMVPAGDPEAAGAAIAALASDPALRSIFGRRSRELMAEWGYEPSIETLIETAREIASR